MQDGKREGAGRPIKGREKKIILSISLEPRIVALLDEKLNKGSRSEYIENLLKKFLKIED